jgi:hypothetical protein
MNSPGRHPIAQSLALAVLGVALVGALIVGAVVFAALLGVFIVGYLVSLAYAYWRLLRLRRRAAYVDRQEQQPVPAAYIDGEFEVVEVSVDAARRGPGNSA